MFRAATLAAVASKPALRAAVSFCALITACSSGVVVARFFALSAAMAASASAAVPVLYVPVTPVFGLVHSNVSLAPFSNLLAANASLNDVGLVTVAAFLSIAPCKSPNSVSM